MATYPLSFLQILFTRSKAVRRQGLVDWSTLRKFFYSHYGVVIDNTLAWRLEQEQEENPSISLRHTPDFVLAYDSINKKYRIYPVDFSHLRSSDPCVQYRYLRGLAHELIHVIDHANPSLLSPNTASWSTRQFSFSNERQALPDLLDFAAEAKEDSGRTIREIIAEDAALFLLAAPKQFCEALRRPGMNNLDLAQKFSISIDDVTRYTQSLLMCNEKDLHAVGVTADDILAFLSRSSHDPIASFVQALIEGGPTGIPETVDAPQFDLDLAALDLTRNLDRVVRHHLHIAATMPHLPSALPVVLDNFIRRHSGSELRFLLRRTPTTPFTVALDLIKRSDPLSALAVTGMMAVKLGFSEIAIKAITSQPDFYKEPKLLEVVALAHLGSHDREKSARALELYKAARDLDPEDPEIRFGLAKAILTVEGFESAEHFLLADGHRRHWLENYLLGKIAYLRYSKLGSLSALDRAQKHLLAALEVGHRWPPKILRYLNTPEVTSWLSPMDLLDIDGDRKKAINLLAKIYEIQSMEQGREDLRALCHVLLQKSWTSHKLDSKTNFCLYEFHRTAGEPSKALLRLRELLHLRLGDPAVWLYLREVILESFSDWGDYAEGINRLVRRLNQHTTRGTNRAKDRRGH